MADTKTLIRASTRFVRSHSILQQLAHRTVETVRSTPILVDALTRLTGQFGAAPLIPLTTQRQAVRAAVEQDPNGPEPERWVIVGVEVHHLGDAEPEALQAVATQQIQNPWFRPAFLISERGIAPARATGCPFDVVPDHAATPRVIGERLADLIGGLGASVVFPAGPQGLQPAHLAAVQVMAARRRAAIESSRHG